MAETPDNAKPDQAKPGETTPGETAPVEAPPGAYAPDSPKPQAAAPETAKPAASKPGAAGPVEAAGKAPEGPADAAAASAGASPKDSESPPKPSPGASPKASEAPPKPSPGASPQASPDASQKAPEASPDGAPKAPEADAQASPPADSAAAGKSDKGDRYFRVAESVWSVGGLGLLPGPTGTYGTLAGIPLFFLLLWTGWKWYLIATAALFLLGWWLSHLAQRRYGNHDDKRVVIDEVVGYLVTMFLTPSFEFLYLAPLWGFAWFRLFDIWKPGPIGRVDKIEGGLFVMLDDVMAGLAASAMTWVTAAVIDLFSRPLTPEIFLK